MDTYADWLQAELRQRFDYACVDSIQSFRSADRAITREGQVKHSKTRHEKDDRRSVGDRRNWVLGFDNREKLGLFQAQAQELAATITRLSAKGNSFLNVDGHNLGVHPTKTKRWGYRIDSRFSAKTYASKDEAKLALFDDFWAATQDDERLWASD